MDTEFEKLIHEYLRYLTLMNRSAATIAAYRFTLQMFDRPLTKDGVQSWLEELRFRMKPASVLSHHKNLRAFCNWSVRQKYLAASPMKNVPEPRVRPGVIEPFSPEQAKALYAVARSPRDRALVAVLLNTGIRIGELVKLRPEDVEMGRLRIRGKGAKMRWVGIALPTQAVLQEYMRLRTGHETVFIVKRQALYWALRKLGKKAGVPNVFPHRLRHTFGIEYLRNGGGINDLQILMGHSSLAMTQRYVAFGQEERAVENHARFAPSVG